MTSFVFKDYDFDEATLVATFEYENNGISFTEKLQFKKVIEGYNIELLDRAMFLAFILIGVSYYKTFPSQEVQINKGDLDNWQVEFFNSVYQEGLSQFAFENELTRQNLAHFSSNTSASASPVQYDAADTVPLILQSGGKDSLLLATLLEQSSHKYDPWFVSTADVHPIILDQLSAPLITVKRFLDRENLGNATASGALDGHVPISYIVFAMALIQAILLGKNTVLTAIGHEGEEPYAYIGDLPVAHQWAKTWRAEQQFNEYVTRYISPGIRLGSPLRRYSELKVAELFVTNCWQKYSRSFSSCNVGNYKQGQDNTHLGWCGNCAKCANSFLLFAPFVEADELTAVFNGENLFKKPSLQDTFKGLLGVDGVTKPFECIGEEAELRMAYQMAVKRSHDYLLSFEVPQSTFDYNEEYPYQEWTGGVVK